LDIHAPDWFVPVLGVTYLNNELNPGRIREELDGLRPTIVSTKGGLEIFNGALALVSLSNESIQAMARHSHVIIADWQRPRVQPTSLVAAANHVITVTKSKVPPERLVLSAQAPDLQKFHVGHEGNVRDGRDNFLVVNSASEYVRQCCDVSLRRLGVDAIDLYYQHRAVPEALAEGLSTAARFSWGSQHRIYLNFTDVQASHWSWNGGTFG
jgi:hypothetical protein